MICLWSCWCHCHPVILCFSKIYLCGAHVVVTIRCWHWDGHLLQVILPLLKSDLFNIFMKCVNGELSQSDVVFSSEHAAVGVVLASHGYPASFPTGFTITGRWLMFPCCGVIWLLIVWDAGIVMYLGQGADLHMAQLMPLPLIISCPSKSRLVLPSWFYLFWCWLTWLVPDKIQEGCKNGCVCGGVWLCGIL